MAAKKQENSRFVMAHTTNKGQIMNQGLILSIMLTLMTVVGCAGQPKPDGPVKEVVTPEKLEAESLDNMENMTPEDLPLGCPRPVILRDLSRQIIVADDTQAFDPKEVIARVELERVAHANCEVKAKSRHGSLEGVVRISAAKGPYFPKDKKSLTATYFMVARKPDGEVVAKTEKEIVLKFDGESEVYVGKIDAIELKHIEINSDEEFDALEFFVGLQFSQESWSFHQKFGPQIFGSKI